MHQQSQKRERESFMINVQQSFPSSLLLIRLAAATILLCRRLLSFGPSLSLYLLLYSYIQYRQQGIFFFFFSFTVGSFSLYCWMERENVCPLAGMAAHKQQLLSKRRVVYLVSSSWRLTPLSDCVESSASYKHLEKRQTEKRRVNEFIYSAVPRRPFWYNSENILSLSSPHIHRTGCADGTRLSNFLW